MKKEQWHLMKENLLILYRRIKPYMNQYVILIVAFVIFIVFIGKNNVIQRVGNNQEIRSLRKEIRRYEKERDETLRQLNDLRMGTNELEKIARERYLMKKDNEEIFILEDE